MRQRRETYEVSVLKNLTSRTFLGAGGGCLERPTAKIRYLASGANGNQYSTSQGFAYDYALRPKDNTMVFWGGSVATPLPRMHISELNYNYKDQVIEKNIGRNDVVSGAKALQSIDYTYNQRGWLTEINQQPLSYHNQIVTSVKVGTKTFQQYSVDPNPTFAIQLGEGSVDLFSESIRYESPDVNFSSLATPQSNGNISQAVWQVAGREQQAYTYKYDDLDRLLEGEYTDIHDMDGLNAGSPYSTDNKFGEKLTYDLRGNIVSLKRNGMIAPGLAGGSVVSGTFGQIDDLKYTYNTQNQVTAITDFSNAAKGFKGGSSAYTYDANGNLKSDVAKGITNIVYNYLNLPQVIQFTGDRSIEFVYDATGTKLRKTVIAPNVAPIVTDYMNGFEYKDGLLEKIHHTEGYVERQANGTFQYNYVLRDHLGNTRVTFADLNNSGTIDPNTEINQINHYAPFGLNLDGNWNGASPDAKNKLQYNEKELVTDFDLNLNDYGARMYDPARGQWTSIDPLADTYKRWSPYCYTKDNPIRFIDPTGMSSETVSPSSPEAQKLYDAHKANASADEKKKLDKLEKSNVDYKINVKSSLPENRAGEINFNNIANNEVNLDIAASGQANEMVEALGDELEHANQFENNEIAAMEMSDGTVKTTGYDQVDEGKSQDAGLKAVEAAGLPPTTNGALWKDATTEPKKADFFDTNYKGLPSGETAGNYGKTDQGIRDHYKAVNSMGVSPTNNQLNYRSNGQTVRVAIPR